MYWDRKILEWIEHLSPPNRMVKTLNNRRLMAVATRAPMATSPGCSGCGDANPGERDTDGKVRTMTDAGPERRAESDEHVSPAEEPAGLEARR